MKPDRHLWAHFITEAFSTRHLTQQTSNTSPSTDKRAIKRKYTLSNAKKPSTPGNAKAIKTKQRCPQFSIQMSVGPQGLIISIIQNGLGKHRMGWTQHPAPQSGHNNAAVWLTGRIIPLQRDSHQGGLTLAAPSEQPWGRMRRMGHDKPNLSPLIHCQHRVNLTHWESDSTGSKGQTELSWRCHSRTCHTLFTARWHCDRKVWECVCAWVHLQGSVNKKDWVFRSGICSVRREDLWMHISGW